MLYDPCQTKALCLAHVIEGIRLMVLVQQVQDLNTLLNLVLKLDEPLAYWEGKNLLKGALE